MGGFTNALASAIISKPSESAWRKCVCKKRWIERNRAVKP